MKKIMIMAAVALVAAVSQAAQIKWSTSSTLLGVDVTSVGDNGNYGASGSRLSGSNSALSFVVKFYEDGFSGQADHLVATWEGDAMKYKATSPYNINLIWADTATGNTLKQGTAYDYVITVTGTQNDLVALGTKNGYDYSHAIISATIEGDITTAPSGATTIPQNIANWKVSGVTSVPEPTSGLLMLIGCSLLGLRRRRA